MIRTALPRITRRGFLAASAATGIAATRAHARTTDPRPRVALIGCGAGGRSLAKALQSPDAPMSLAAVCDSSTARSMHLAAWTGSDSENRWERVLDRPDIDALLIATPDHLHTEMAAAALDAGKHVYVLPPVATSSRTARDLHLRGLRRDRMLYIGMAADQDLLWRAARRLLASRDGRLRWIQVSVPRVPAAIAGHWSRDPLCSLGPAATQVFNVLYPLQHHLMLCAPALVTALGGAFDGDPDDTPDALTVRARYGNGATVVISCADGAAHRQPPILRGDWGAMELQPAAETTADALPDLRAFAQAMVSPDDRALSRIHDACSVQAALCDALYPPIPFMTL